MSFITVDFETYYDKDIGFKTQTNEEYLNEPRFEVVGVAVKVDDGETVWFSGTDAEIKEFLKQYDWEDSGLLCHNMLFDGAILAWRYGIVPAFYFDTLCMARAVHGLSVGGSLAKLAEYYNVGAKGTEVVNAYGKRRADFSPDELSRYGAYCCNDVQLTYKIFDYLSQGFPEIEYKLIDLTLRMYTQPVLYLDDALLVARLEEVRAQKSEMLAGLMEKMQVDSEEAVRAKLASNPQFANLLVELGVEPPKKLSPTTGKETFALAKNDEGFIALTEHDDPFIQQLCAVRLGTKSTIEQSRVERFIGIGARNKGLLPIPLKYYGAHTGRWSGQDSVNLQNLPSRDKKKKALKNAIRAPHDCYVVNCDSSQIEARVLAWLAGQDDVVEQFRREEDVYSVFASEIYGFKVTKENPIERFVGKTCVGIGSLVLCKRGWVPIEQVELLDQVWDGEEWVCHNGVVSNGMKETLPLHGLWLTPDHQVWSGIWQRADSLLHDGDTLSRALDIAAANLPSQATWLADEVFGPSLYGAIAGQKNIQLTLTISKILSQLAALCVQQKQQVQNVIGNMLKRCLTTLIEPASLTVSPQQLPVAIQLPQAGLSTTVEGGSAFTMGGAKTGRHFYATSKHCRDGMLQTYKWTGLITARGMSRGTFGSSHAPKTCTTEEKWPTLRPVFDILNCGSRNRFTVLTERGPLIVHNCVLGLGYGTGHKKLRHTLKTQPPGVEVSEQESERFVGTYRRKNERVVGLWREADRVLEDLMSWPTDKDDYWLGIPGSLRVTRGGIRLPNGLYIRYKNLRRSDGEIVHDGRKGTEAIWGGTVVETVVQALARIIGGEQMVNMSDTYRPVLTVHDAAVIVIPKPLIEQAIADITKVMSTPPAWCATLPVACEAKFGESYGEC